MLPQKPTESRPELKKKKKTSEPPHHYEGKNSRKWNLTKKSKHRPFNEPSLQTKTKTHLISSALLKEVTEVTEPKNL